MGDSQHAYPTWAKMSVLPNVSLVNRTKSKPSWQIARDISMDLLSRRATKLSFKQVSQTSSLIDDLPLTNRDVQLSSDQTSRIPNATRLPRMPSEEQAMLTTIAHNTNCSFCEDTCIDSFLRCRICVRVYHCKCLYVRGYMSASFTMPRTRKQNWTCPECRDLTRLLTEQELHYLIQAFDHIDRNNDGLIILDEYLSLNEDSRLPAGFELFIQHNPELGRTYYRLMDIRNSDAISWSDFAAFYSCKLIAAKNKTELAMKLSEKELVRARNLFWKDPRKTLDDKRNILITREHLRDVCHDLVDSLKEKYGKEFIDAILDYDRDFENTLDQPMMLNWEEFLRETAVFLLLDRSNHDRIGNRTVRHDVEKNLVKIPTSAASIAVKSSIRPRPSQSKIPSTSFLPNLFNDEPFRKHAKILEKLRQNQHDDDFKRKQYGSVIDYSIVESLDEEIDEKLPKLKCYRRDDRNVVVDPWTAVKDIQRLRTQPIGSKTSFLSQTQRKVH